MSNNTNHKGTLFEKVFIGSDLIIDEVKDRYDVRETPTGQPKKVRCAYIDWKDSLYNGAMLTKADLKKLKKWCEQEIEHFDDEDKEIVR